MTLSSAEICKYVSLGLLSMKPPYSASKYDVDNDGRWVVCQFGTMVVCRY